MFPGTDITLVCPASTNAAIMHIKKYLWWGVLLNSKVGERLAAPPWQLWGVCHVAPQRHLLSRTKVVFVTNITESRAAWSTRRNASDSLLACWWLCSVFLMNYLVLCVIVVGVFVSFYTSWSETRPRLHHHLACIISSQIDTFLWWFNTLWLHDPHFYYFLLFYYLITFLLHYPLMLFPSWFFPLQLNNMYVYSLFFIIIFFFVCSFLSLILFFLVSFTFFLLPLLLSLLIVFGHFILLLDYLSYRFFTPTHRLQCENKCNTEREKHSWLPREILHLAVMFLCVEHFSGINADVMKPPALAAKTNTKMKLFHVTCTATITVSSWQQTEWNLSQLFRSVYL